MSKKENIHASLFAENDRSMQERFPERYRSRMTVLQSVIAKLREEDLNQGHCFLIFDDSLPEDQAYYEYPDGSIRIEKLDKRNIDVPRTVIKVLNRTESASVRKKHVFA
ncbi:MAG TPA: hypothetical protein VIM77_13465 [Mucilaginibacter sp.]